MARAGETVENAMTGESVTFLELDSGLLVMENVWSRPDHATVPHVHPRIDERWTVLEGSVRFLIGDDEVAAAVGETVSARAGTPHMAANACGGPVRLRIEMEPALRWAEFVERLFAAAGNRRALVRLLPQFPDEVAPAPPGWPGRAGRDSPNG